MEKLIDDIKSDFRSEISLNDPKVKKYNKLQGEIFGMTNQTQMFELTKREKAAWNKKLKYLAEDSKKLETIIEEIKNNKIYEDAFEWRFEFPEVLDDNGDFLGFDIVIGNPPYVQQRKSKGNTALFSRWYSVYSGTADLSIFFFEKAFNLLKENGQFAFINTNKFFNTEYGKLLRTYLSQFRMNKIVNFELVPIFDEALVSSVILTMDKSIPNLSFEYLEFNNEDITQEKFDSRKENNFVIIDNSLLSNDFWLFSRIEEQAIISKMKKQGNIISSFDSIQIKRGITTGYDAAFIINDTSTLFDSHLAKSFLRGRDIHRYKIEKNNLKLLFVPWHYPLHEDESISGASELAEDTFKNKYNNEYQHLQSFKTELSNRNKSETGKRYEWYALQRCAASYYPLFDEEKIVWGLISGGWDFAFDKKGNLLTSSSFFLTSDTLPLKFILALFNSKLYQFYFSIVGEKTAGGAYVFKKTTIEKFLIPNNLSKIGELAEKVEQILKEDSLEIKNEIEEETYNISCEIDQLVYQLYDLTEEEIKIIEEAIA
jgi:hypothetical protein